VTVWATAPQGPPTALRSRRRPVRATVPPLSRPLLMWHDHIGARLAMPVDHRPQIALIRQAGAGLCDLSDAEFATRVASRPGDAESLTQASGAADLALVI
jgi:hypothetical protein